MSKTECPVCGSYSSTITQGLQNNRECPICQTSEETILQLELLEQKKKFYKTQKVQEDVIKENYDLNRELIIKRGRYDLFKNILWNMHYGLEKLTKEVENEYMNKMKSWDDYD